MNCTDNIGRDQKGMGLLVLLVVLIVIGVLALGVMRILPMYLDHFAVQSALKGLQEDPASRNMSPMELRQAIGKRFDVNYVSHLKAQDLKIRREQNRTLVQADYEIRRSLVANLDLIAHFDETVVIESR